MNQKGFATLEMILVITIIGIVAAIAVPRFTDVTAKANTAKIQADLSTLDSAISIYQMEKGEKPNSINDLEDYIQDVENLEPPTGSAFKGSSTAEKINNTSYNLNEDKTRATLDGKTAGEFGKK